MMIKLSDIAEKSGSSVNATELYWIDGEAIEPVFAHRMWDVCNDLPITILAIFASSPGKFKAVDTIAKAVLENRDAEYTDAVKERVAQLLLEDKLEMTDYPLALVIPDP